MRFNNFYNVPKGIYSNFIHTIHTFYNHSTILKSKYATYSNTINLPKGIPTRDGIDESNPGNGEFSIKVKGLINILASPNKFIEEFNKKSLECDIEPGIYSVRIKLRHDYDDIKFLDLWEFQLDFEYTDAISLWEFYREFDRIVEGYSQQFWLSVLNMNACIFVFHKDFYPTTPLEVIQADQKEFYKNLFEFFRISEITYVTDNQDLGNDSGSGNDSGEDSGDDSKGSGDDSKG